MERSTIPGMAKAVVYGLALGLMYTVVMLGLFVANVFAATQGSLNTLGVTLGGDILETSTPAAHKPRQMSLKLSFLAPDKLPLDTIFRRAMAEGKMVSVPKDARNVKHEWEMDGVIPRKTTVDGTVSTGAGATLVVDTASIFRAGDLLQFPDNATAPGFYAYVTSKTNSTTFVISRVNPASSESAFVAVPEIGDGEIVVKITSAKEEASSRGTSVSVFPDQFYNYAFINDELVGISGTRKFTSNYGGVHDWARNQDRALLNLRRNAEIASLLSPRFRGTPGTNELRLSNGAANYITTNRITYTAGTLSESILLDWMNQIFWGNNGSDVRLFFPTPALALTISKLLASSNGLRWDRSSNVLGVTATKIEYGNAKLMMMPSQELTEHGKTQWGVILDPANISRVPYRELQTLKTNGSDLVDADYIRWLEEWTIQVDKETTHAIVYDSATDAAV